MRLQVATERRRRNVYWLPIRGPVCWLTGVIFLCSGAQTPSLSVSAGSGAPGDSVTLTVNLSYNGGTRPASVQWDLSYSTADLAPMNGTFFSTGPAATAAEKSVICNSPAYGTLRCLVSGLNKSSIADGALASVTFHILPSTKTSSTTVSVTNPLGADRTAAAISMGGADTVVSVAQPAPSSKLK
jgi:hypothetical protein